MSKLVDKYAKTFCKAAGKDHVMTFGKYKGWSLHKILYNFPGYIVWLDENNVLAIEPELLERAKNGTSPAKND
jgi:hypothetical protein